tara:strand:+ start:357 stop:1088 length:732 start_codon:yes stop_codon:yes gene_type:complete
MSNIKYHLYQKKRINKDMIDNTHPLVKVPSSAIYLLEYFDSLGYNVRIHEDWNHLKNLLESQEDYPFDMDAAFTTEYMLESNIAFAIYLKKGDNIVATYAAKDLHPGVVREGLTDLYPNLIMEKLPDILNLDDFQYYYSSCQWVHSDHLGKKLGVSLDLLKKHIIFDSIGGDVNYAIHRINDSMKSYHIDKLHYSDSETFAKQDEYGSGLGGAGGEKDREYNIVWTIKDSFQTKVEDIKSTYK